MRLKERFRKVLDLDAPPESVARGAAIGAAIAVTPTVGVQTVLALLLCRLFRSSKVAGVAMTLALNPIGWIPPGPWIIADYYVGATLTGGDYAETSRIKEAFKSDEEGFWTRSFAVVKKLLTLGKELLFPILVGSAVLAVAAGLLSYHITLRSARRKEKGRG